MISPLGATMHCIAAVGVALGLFAQMAFRQVRTSPYKHFNLFLYSLSLNVLGTALLTDAPDLAAGAFAQRLQLLGQALALIFYVDFQQRATRDESMATIRTLRILCAGLLVVAASGFMLVPGLPSPTASLRLSIAVIYPELALSRIGYAAYGLAMLLVIRSLLKLWRSRAIELGAPLFRSLALLNLSVLHDQCIRFGLLESTYMLGFSSVGCMLVVSTSRTREFVQDGLALRRRSEELEKSYGQLKKAQDALVQTRRLAAIGELSAVIAHEVRNPLAVIKNAASSLRRRESLPRKTRSRLLEIADEEVSRLARLIDDMLTYAKPLRPDLALHGPRALVEASIALASAEPGIPGDVAIEVEDRCDDDLLLHVDGRLIAHALSNILSNALRASPTGGRIALLVHEPDPTICDGRGVQFQIRDTGEGMDRCTQQKATDPFFTTRPKGMGLGLAIVRRITQAHHGCLELQSRTGTGTTVNLDLPAHTMRIGDTMRPFQGRALQRNQ